MSHPYYYFSASLPMIEFEGKPSMTVEAFLRDAQRLLQEQDNHLLSSLLLGHADDIQSNDKDISEYLAFERGFRNEMVLFRAERAHKDPLDYTRGDRCADINLVEIIHTAAKESNLLEAEKILDRVRWQFLDELALGHYYDLVFLITYGLKLRILARYQEFCSPKGREIFDQLRTQE